MKITRIGWVGKNQKLMFEPQWDGTIGLKQIFPDKGNKYIWCNDYPPRKVRITVEDVEK